MQTGFEQALGQAHIILQSGGWKNNGATDLVTGKTYTVPQADVYIDCRGIANPFHAKNLSGQTGDHKGVQDWVEERTNVQAYLDQVLEALTRIPARRQVADPFAKPVVVQCMCAHGIHRSRAMKHILAHRLTQLGGKVEVK